MSLRSFSVVVTTLTILGSGLSATGNVEATDASAVKTSSPQPAQNYWFEVEYKNLAKAPECRGFSIDAAGQVCTYNLGQEKWEPAQPESLTEDELFKKYEHGKRCDAPIDAPTFRKFTALVPSAAKGEMSERKSTCFDAGTLAVRAFSFDKASGRYHPVLLSIGGDFESHSLSPDAAAIVVWLKSLRPEYSKPPCSEPPEGAKR